jgi:hypothetical protein
MTRLIRTLLALCLLGVTQGLPAQVRSAAGTCTGGGFSCDAATVLRGAVQFTDNSESYTRYMTFAGFQDAEDPTMLHVTEIVRDGKHIGSVGQCFTRGDLSEIVCSALGTQIVFTQGSK